MSAAKPNATGKQPRRECSRMKADGKKCRYQLADDNVTGECPPDRGCRGRNAKTAAKQANAALVRALADTINTAAPVATDTERLSVQLGMILASIHAGELEATRGETERLTGMVRTLEVLGSSPVKNPL